MAFGFGHPELLTPCFDIKSRYVGNIGPMHPLKEETYQFLDAFLKEVIGLFPEVNLHIGGDEVAAQCW